MFIDIKYLKMFKKSLSLILFYQERGIMLRLKISKYDRILFVVLIYEEISGIIIIN